MHIEIDDDVIERWQKAYFLKNGHIKTLHEEDVEELCEKHLMNYYSDLDELSYVEEKYK